MNLHEHLAEVTQHLRPQRAGATRQRLRRSRVGAGLAEDQAVRTDLVRGELHRASAGADTGRDRRFCSGIDVTAGRTRPVRRMDGAQHADCSVPAAFAERYGEQPCRGSAPDQLERPAGR